MVRSIEILKGDWERLRRAYPDMGREQLLEEIVARGSQRLAEEPQESVRPDATVTERVAWLRRWTPRQAASIATLGFELVKNRGRHQKATVMEGLTYQRDIQLKRDVVPEMKVSARALREEMLRLEAELKARGGDPNDVEPRVPDDALAVSDYERAQFETSESRRKTTLDFFRRLDGYKK